VATLPCKLRLAGDWAPCDRRVVTVLDSVSLVVNIEGPILTGSCAEFEKQLKAGPTMFNRYAPVASQPSVAVLANNHLMDFGARGLDETIKTLEGQSYSKNWRCVGAGITKEQANRPLVFEADGIEIGILSRCETQFGVATPTKAGVAAFDARVYDQIRSLKEKVDYVIVSVHAAAEMFPWPSPRRQETWRSLIDAGADIVHGHHSHVPQGWEEYKGGFVFYGLGNFCVDPNKWNWHPQGLWSLAPEFTIDSQGISMSPKTVVIEEMGDSIRVRDANAVEHAKRMVYLDQCNRDLNAPLLLEGLWQEASIKMYNQYYSRWLGFGSDSMIKSGLRLARAKLGRFKRMLIDRSFAGNRNPTQNQLLIWYHLFACDSHNDAIATALGVLGGELEDRRTEETARMVDRYLVLD